MTVYKYFIKLALRNKGIIFSYITIFFVFSILNSSSSVDRQASFIETKLNIGIVDNANSELSKGLKGYLAKKNNIIDTIEDENYIKEQIFLEIADAVIIIPEDFDEKVVNKGKSIELYKDDRKIESLQIKNQVNKFLTFVNATYEKGQFDLNNVSLALDEETKVELIETNNKGNKHDVRQWFKYYYNFTSYIIIAMYISILGLVMNDFTDNNIKNRMKISSKRFLQFNKEIYLGQLTVAAMITLVFLLGSLVLKAKYIGEINFAKYLINITIFSFSILCLTFLINNITSNKFIKHGIGTVLSLGTSFISGVMVPQQFLEKKVLTIAKFFPTYYFVRINEMNVNSLLDIKYEIMMQLLFATIFLLMGLYFFKVRQKA